MNFERFEQIVASAAELEELIGLPGELVIRKQLDRLDRHMCSFIEQSPFVLIGTVDGQGRCDVSPRGDIPAAARVLDTGMLIIADRPGNRRADSLRNILQTGRIGLLFMIPGVSETLRVNGHAVLVRDHKLLADMAVNGRRPTLGIAVAVEECYLQCAKALLRSRLWDTAGADNRPALPCFAEMLIDQTGIEDESVASLTTKIEDSYANRLY